MVQRSASSKGCERVLRRCKHLTEKDEIFSIESTYQCTMSVKHERCESHVHQPDCSLVRSSWAWPSISQWTAVTGCASADGHMYVHPRMHCNGSPHGNDGKPISQPGLLNHSDFNLSIDFLYFCIVANRNRGADPCVCIGPRHAELLPVGLIHILCYTTMKTKTNTSKSKVKGAERRVKGPSQKKKVKLQQRKTAFREST